MVSENRVFVDLHYFPSIQYFVNIIGYDDILISNDCFYIKQSYHNRCYILTSQGVNKLVIPLVGSKHRLLYKEARILNSKKVLKTHWHSICTAYGKAPYFTFLKDVFEGIFFKKYDFLLDLNLDIITLCFKVLGINKYITVVSNNNIENVNTIDIINKISPKNCCFNDDLYIPFQYYQVFSETFAPNLSILDLLFCCGPESYYTLRKSMKKT